jgi:acetoin utilization protein AcuB
MPVRDWMQRRVITVGADARVGTAARLMKAKGIRHLPVVDAAGRLAGIVTDRDLRQVVLDPSVQARLAVAPRALSRLVVRDVMTWGVISVTPDMDVRDAARIMREGKLGALPVVTAGKLVGMLSETDLLVAFEDLLRKQVHYPRPLTPQAGTGQAYDYGFPVPDWNDPWRTDGDGD